jgi:predicted nucleic acid-binding protein
MIQLADTFYFLALLNPKDRAHSAALEHSFGPGRILTTEWVLTELADAMASRAKRQGFVDLYQLLRADPQVEIVPVSSQLFTSGIELYSNRPDKDWSLTDCISFVVMQQRGITDALTGDHHFEQAGFRALLN